MLQRAHSPSAEGGLLDERANYNKIESLPYISNLPEADCSDST